MLIPLLTTFHSQAQVKTGAERTDLYASALRGKSMAIVANGASMMFGSNVVDALLSMGCNVKIIFSPEHGFRQFSEAGQGIENFSDPVTGIPVISLYGNKKKPSAEDLRGIEAMVFDLQDVGVRFFTYISTLTYVMEACAENRIPLIVLDRPNPNGFYIDGPVLEPGFASYTGMHPVPIVYGMTIGEYAQMVNGEGWLTNGMKCDLRVVPLENYTHQTLYELPVKPSPNLTNMNAVYLYPSICLFEGTVVSPGRGTDHPFEMYGHPELFSGSYSFTPRSIPSMSLHPPFEGKQCWGFAFLGWTAAYPEKMGKIQLSWLIDAFAELGSKKEFFTEYFDKLAGNSSLREQILKGVNVEDIRDSWEPALQKFQVTRAKYLLYE